jgi:cyclohexyl-isocyanide hydratase
MSDKIGTDIVMLLFPGFNALDLVGPMVVMSAMPDARIHLVWKTLDPVRNDRGIGMLPTATFANALRPGILFVPGGTMGVLDQMEDSETLDFLRNKAEQADYVTSVCTGSLILGAAGLLDGYRAATHWTTRELLADLGAIPCADRVVRDRNRISGGGITAGIDFGLAIAALLHGDERAKAIQLALEYDPAPPFDTGTPEKAGEALTGAVKARFGPFIERAGQVARKVGGARHRRPE